MVTVAAGVPGVAVYMDDIMIHGPDRATHDQRLNEVFQRLHHHYLTVNVEKCIFTAKEVPFVGQDLREWYSPVVIRCGGSSAVTRTYSSSRIEFVPRHDKLLRTVPAGCAEIFAPLMSLLRTDAQWHLSPELQVAFDTLTQLVTSAPILAHFSSEADIIVSCDASGVALGAVLSLIQDGQKRPVAYASRTLSPAEQKYTVGGRETLACVWACKNGKFLFGRRFLLFTDHQALTSLREWVNGRYDCIVRQNGCAGTHSGWNIVRVAVIKSPIYCRGH